MSAGVVLLAAATLLSGCWDSTGRITPESLREFWARVDRDLRSNLLRPEPATGLAPEGTGRQVRPAAERPGGTLYASRRGNVILVDVNLYGVPEDAKMVAMGLKLREGTPVPPRTLLLLTDATRYRPAVPRVDFGFDGRPGKLPAPEEHGLCLRVTYELDGAAPSVDGGAFALVLGQPDGDAGCRLGITSGVSLRDGGPMLMECVRLPWQDAPPGPSLPAPPPADVPTVTFRFEETPPKPSADTLLWIVPRVAPAGDGTHGRATIAAGQAAE